MAYRRKQGITKQATFKEEIYNDPINTKNNVDSARFGLSSKSFPSPSPSPSSLAAQAIRASAAHRESSAYDGSRSAKAFGSCEETTNRNEPRTGFWGVLAQKAKSILDEDAPSEQFESSARSRWQMPDVSTRSQLPHQATEGRRRMDNPAIRKKLDAITSSLNQIGDSFEKAFEEGRTIVGNKTADIIQETRKLQIGRKGNSEGQNPASAVDNSWQGSSRQPLPLQNQTNPETQLKASREVAMATAAKAKLLLRELKTVKADLAFAKLRCSQLEEENKMLREGREKGLNAADDDLIRLQLETLLAEKARLAHENEIFARENRFLREIVEYHQLTMQDVVYIDDGTEEVTEVSPIPSVSKVLSVSPPSPSSPPSPEPPSRSPMTKENCPASTQAQENEEIPESKVETVSTSVSETVAENERRS